MNCLEFQVVAMLALTLFLCAGALAVPQTHKPIYQLEKAEEYFEEFISKFNRNYADEAEKKMRFEIFKQQLIGINERNMDVNEHAVYGISKFTDHTKEEMKQYTGFLDKPDDCNLMSSFYSTFDSSIHKCKLVVVKDQKSDNLPDSFDWRTKKAVTSVKDQGQCGSCWTFGTMGNIEGQYAIKYKKLVSFSEQQLIDCDKIDNGCGGGRYNTSFGAIIGIGGVMSENDYPYQAMETKHCNFNPKKVVAKLKDCVLYNIENEDALRAVLVQQGPIAISICASCFEPSYLGGIINCSNGPTDHSVLLVGYGKEGDIPYWIIKNSWGTNFGEDGYFRLRRNVNACNLANPCAGSSIIA